MVKLASAREIRLYGTRLSRNRAEYMNAGLYIFATIVLTSGFAAIFSMEPRSGLVLMCIALALIMIVNLHDLLAHLAGIDFRLHLVEFDPQLGLVEFAVPIVQFFGALIFFLGIFFLFLQEEKGYGFYKFERHALNMLVAGPVLWVIGSIHNSCQIYERAGGHVQILQESVQIPFLMGSLLFLVGSVLNIRKQQPGLDYHGLQLLSKTYVWMGIIGGLMVFIGGLTNMVKVFKMQQIDGLRLEKLRGGAQEQLIRQRERQMPLITGDEDRRRKLVIEEVRVVPNSNINSNSSTVPTPTPYKDVLLGQP